MSFWEGGSAVCGEDTWEERGQVSNGTRMRAWRKTRKRDAPGRELGMVWGEMPSA